MILSKSSSFIKRASRVHITPSLLRISPNTSLSHGLISTSSTLESFSLSPFSRSFSSISESLTNSTGVNSIPDPKTLSDFINDTSSSCSSKTKDDLRLNIFSLSVEDLETLLIELKFPKFHAKSIFHSIYTLGIADFNNMTSLPLKLREILSEKIKFGTLSVLSEEISKDGTIKRAYSLEDGQLIESVLMPYNDGRFTVCISSQAGCAMGCKFCATGQMGFSRQLKVEEINEQLFRFFSLLKNHNNIYHEKLSTIDQNFKNFLKFNKVNDDFYQFYDEDDSTDNLNQKETSVKKKKKTESKTFTDSLKENYSIGAAEVSSDSSPIKVSSVNAFPSYRLSNIVFMGMGEPLLNYENVKKSLEFITQKLKISARSVTVSTVGIAPRIKLLANEIKAKKVPPVNLAISLHFASDEEREKLMPVNKKYNLAELMSSVKFFSSTLNKRISFEWALIRGISDTQEVAYNLGNFLKGMKNIHVNLIPLNPTTQFDEKASNKDDVDRFISILDDYRIPATVRVRRGIDISAGCGQLKAKVMRTKGKFKEEITKD